MRSTLQSSTKKIFLSMFFIIALTSCVEKQTQYFIFVTVDLKSDSWKYYKTDIYNPSFFEELKIIPCAKDLPFWSPNGKYYGCSAVNDQPFLIYDSQNKITSELSQGNPNDPSQWIILGWSPDSQYVSMLNSGSKEKPYHDFSIMKYDGAELLQINKQSNATIANGEWSPNGMFIAHQMYAKDHAYLIIFQPTGKEVARIDLSEFIHTPIITYINKPIVIAQQIKWSPDSKKLAFHTYHSWAVDSQLHIWNIETGKISEVIPDKSVCIMNISDWSPDGKKILFEARTCRDMFEYRSMYYSINIDGSDLKPLTEKGYTRLYWTPDGKSILIDGLEGIYLADVDGSNKKKVLDDGSFVSWITP